MSVGNLCKFLLLTILSIACLSCKKDNLSIDYQKIETGTNADLYDIFFVTDQLAFMCGGNKNSGIVLKSDDGANTWDIVNTDLPFTVHAIHFYDSLNGIAAGTDFNLHFTADGGLTWNAYWFGNYPSVEYLVTLRTIKFYNDSAGFMCGGDRFDKGIILYTNNKGVTWKFQTFDHELRALNIIDEQQGFCGGYGLVIETQNAGTSWTNNDVPPGFYTGLSSLNDVSLMCSFNGNILMKNNTQQNWKPVLRSSNLTGPNFYFNAIAFQNETTAYAVGDDGVLAMSKNGGNSWKVKKKWLDNDLNAITCGPDNKIYIGGNNGVLIRIAD